MKKPLLLVGALLVGAVLIALLLKRPGEVAAVQQEEPASSFSKKQVEVPPPVETFENADIPVAQPPAEMPTLRKSVATDPESTEALINIISRHPNETARLREENQWIKRREIVEREESFRNIGKRILRGGTVEEIEIPLFDGETATFVVNQERTQITSDKSGTFFGTIKDSEDSFAVLTYYKDEDSGFINLPEQDMTVQYEGWGKNRVIVKDYDENEHSRLMPCGICSAEGTASNHSDHSTAEEQ